jgi:dUTP pyrophosphatase
MAHTTTDQTNIIEQLQEQINYLTKKVEELQHPKKKLGIKLLTPTAKMPTQAHKGDLWDIYADQDIMIVDGESKLVSTGIAFDIPEGYQVRLYNRSGNPLKYKLVLSNSVGVVDSAYRGEIKGQFFCIHGCYKINKGDKIMQMEIVKINDIEFEQVEDLSKTDRGANGFGSSGK